MMIMQFAENLEYTWGLQQKFTSRPILLYYCLLLEQLHPYLAFGPASLFLTSKIDWFQAAFFFFHFGDGALVVIVPKRI
jgi:hypothetical protein